LRRSSDDGVIISYQRTFAQAKAEAASKDRGIWNPFLACGAERGEEAIILVNH
jgi:hypothetical protein